MEDDEEEEEDETSEEVNGKRWLILRFDKQAGSIETLIIIIKMAQNKSSSLKAHEPVGTN